MTLNKSEISNKKLVSSNCYLPCDDLWIITCYFNPNDYRTKLENYEVFERTIRESGLNLLTVECAFGNEEFELSSFQNVIQVRTNSVLWQKENLLNVGIENLPSSVTKIVWADCDILFTNKNWAFETSKLLEFFPIVQPFHKAIRLPRGHTHYQGEGHIWESFAYVKRKNPNLHLSNNFNLHGHTGMVWAARAEILRKHKLYNGCISGSADHVMAHAMCGKFKARCVEDILGSNKIKNQLFRHFLSWAYPFYGDVKGQIQNVSGEVLHLWHGEFENRRYYQRHKELLHLKFNPYTDVKISDNGTWEWSNPKLELSIWAKTYFQHRLEDG